MTKTDDALQERLLEALERAETEHPDGDIVIFTEAQAQALIEVAKWWIALRGVSMVGGVLGSAVKWFALIIGAWIAFRSGFTDWIAANIGGGSGQ